MVSSSPDCSPQPRPEPAKVVIDTRFGQFEFDRAQSINMPRGMMGFANHKSFGLVNLPDPRLRQFMLLQSLSDPAVSFLLLPLSIENGPVDAADIEEARKALSISPEDLAVVMVVAIRNVGGKAQFSVNLRAPVFFDGSSRTGCQYVLPNGKYPVRHILAPGGTGDPGADAA